MSIWKKKNVVRSSACFVESVVIKKKIQEIKDNFNARYVSSKFIITYN
jgi:hypothetical protein